MKRPSPPFVFGRGGGPAHPGRPVVASGPPATCNGLLSDLAGPTRAIAGLTRRDRPSAKNGSRPCAPCLVTMRIARLLLAMVAPRRHSPSSPGSSAGNAKCGAPRPRRRAARDLHCNSVLRESTLALAAAAGLRLRCGFDDLFRLSRQRAAVAHSPSRSRSAPVAALQTGVCSHRRRLRLCLAAGAVANASSTHRSAALAPAIRGLAPGASGRSGPGARHADKTALAVLRLAAPRSSSASYENFRYPDFFGFRTTTAALTKSRSKRRTTPRPRPRVFYQTAAWRRPAALPGRQT